MTDIVEQERAMEEKLLAFRVVPGYFDEALRLQEQYAITKYGVVPDGTDQFGKAIPALEWDYARKVAYWWVYNAQGYGGERTYGGRTVSQELSVMAKFTMGPGLFSGEGIGQILSAQQSLSFWTAASRMASAIDALEVRVPTGATALGAETWEQYVYLFAEGGLGDYLAKGVKAGGDVAADVAGGFGRIVRNFITEMGWPIWVMVGAILIARSGK